MTTDPDRRARIEFDAAAYLNYAKEHTMEVTFSKRHAACYDVLDTSGTLIATIFKDSWGWIAQVKMNGYLEYIASGRSLKDTKAAVVRHFQII
jgi:hypothetical protein